MQGFAGYRLEEGPVKHTCLLSFHRSALPLGLVGLPLVFLAGRARGSSCLIVHSPQANVARLVSSCQDELVSAGVEGQMHNAILCYLVHMSSLVIVISYCCYSKDCVSLLPLLVLIKCDHSCSLRHERLRLQEDRTQGLYMISLIGWPVVVLLL